MLQEKQHRLESALKDVARHIDEGDNRNVIMKNRSGTRWRHYHIQEDQLHASADGQKFETHLETFKTRYSSKYFGTNKGITAMTLVANHSALNARIIGSNEHESHYIYDCLLYTSDAADE